MIGVNYNSNDINFASTDSNDYTTKTNPSIVNFDKLFENLVDDDLESIGDNHQNKDNEMVDDDLEKI